MAARDYPQPQSQPFLTNGPLTPQQYSGQVGYMGTPSETQSVKRSNRGNAQAEAARGAWFKEMGTSPMGPGYSQSGYAGASNVRPGNNPLVAIDHDPPDPEDLIRGIGFKMLVGPRARELPLYTEYNPSSVQAVNGILQQFLQGGGNFRSVADIVDQIMSDPRVRATLQTRCSGLLGCQLMWGEQEGKGEEPDEEAKEKATGKGQPGEDPDDDAAKWLEDNFSFMFSAETLWQVMVWGRMLGVAPIQLTWKMHAGMLVPVATCWHPRNLTWRWDTESFWITTYNGYFEIQPGDGEWMLYTPYGLKRGWAYSLIRCLAIPWMARMYALKDWARYSEVHGIPIRKAIVPNKTERAKKDLFMQACARLVNENIILLERGAGANGEETGFDLEILQAEGQGSVEAVFHQLIAQMDSDIAVAVLGQTLTTEVVQGSKAAAQVHNQVREDIRKDDATTLASCIKRQCIDIWATLNYGSQDASPKMTWDIEPPEDLDSKSAQLLALAQALQPLQAVCPRIDIDKLMESFGVPLLSEEEGEAKKQEMLDQKKDEQDAQTDHAIAVAGAKGNGASKTPPPNGGSSSHTLLGSGA